jgi:hypothetical protein
VSSSCSRSSVNEIKPIALFSSENFSKSFKYNEKRKAEHFLLEEDHYYNRNNSILNEIQCGFRKGYSTVDNIFVLHSFFELIELKKKKLFAGLVDFEKAFV